MSAEVGSVIDKAAVREVLTHLIEGGWFSEGEIGIEQATNRICSLQRSPVNIQEAAMTVVCRYCGRTPGNRCYVWTQKRNRDAHPSRIADALGGAS